MSDVVVLGWREWVALPDLGIARLRAKVDTGARSSALHVDAHWRFVEGGAPWVGFRLHVGRRQPREVEACAPLRDERDVVDSGGHRSRRLFLRTTLQLAGHAREIELNLCDRRGMLFPMLIGRSALDGLFAVDPARSFVHGRLLDRKPQASIGAPADATAFHPPAGACRPTGYQLPATGFGPA